MTKSSKYDIIQSENKTTAAKNKPFRGKKVINKKGGVCITAEILDKAGRYFLEHSEKDPCDVFNDFCDEFKVSFTDKEAFKLLDMFMKLRNIDKETCEFFLKMQKDEDKMS